MGNGNWETVKAGYLRQVEKALASAGHREKKQVLEDVRSHLDQRFSELGPDEQTWENMQTIITEMGPATDYAELLEPDTLVPRQSTGLRHFWWIGVIAIVVAGAVFLPNILTLKVDSGQGMNGDNLIVLGERVGEFTLGISKDEVLKKLGKPEMIFYGEERYTLENLPSKYFMVFDDISFGIVDDSVKGITVLSPLYKFSNGLGVGDSEQKIKQTFGDDFHIKEFEIKDFLIYENEGLEFEIHKNSRTVLEINVTQKNSFGNEHLAKEIKSEDDQKEAVGATVPPMVINTTPRVFANDVSPDLKEITVKFDQPMMNLSWSWVGGGQTFPEMMGQPQYDKSKRTCTLPVKLEAGRFYWVGINSPQHKNFQTDMGVAVVPYVILFATRDESGKPIPIPENFLEEARSINSAHSRLAAVDSATFWLGLIDDGDYGASWGETADIFKNAATKEQWEGMAKTVRQPLGKVISRRVMSKMPTQTVSGGPDGEYVIIQFKTSFENKADAIETVTPMLDEDGVWRVTGYYIR